MKIIRLYSFVLLTFSLMFLFSCNKNERFIADNDFSTTVQIKAFTVDPSMLINVIIDDSSWQKITVNNLSYLQTIFTQEYAMPLSGTSHIQIICNDTSVIVDTILTLKSLNRIYLIQFEQNELPVFSTSFGDGVTTPADSGYLKTRFYFKRDSSDLTPLPSTIKLQFYKLVGVVDDYYEVKDTSVELTDGQLSAYFQLPDCSMKEDGKDVWLGYQIIDPLTNTIIQNYCFSSVLFGVVQISKGVGGDFQTYSFDYLPSEPGCDFGSPTEIYKTKLLFGSK